MAALAQWTLMESSKMHPFLKTSVGKSCASEPPGSLRVLLFQVVFGSYFYFAVTFNFRGS